MEFSYWYVAGLAQGIRYLLAANKNLECTEIAQTDMNQWFSQNKTELAKQTTFPNLPYLKLKNGSVITQSSAIFRFLGRISKMDGNNEESALVKIDVVNGILDDLWSKWVKLIFDHDGYESKKAAAHGRHPPPSDGSPGDDQLLALAQFPQLAT